MQSLHSIIKNNYCMHFFVLVTNFVNPIIAILSSYIFGVSIYALIFKLVKHQTL